MIRYLEHLTPESMQELSTFCENSVFGLKALGPVLSYGLKYDFVSAWEQRSEEGQLTAFLSKYYGALTVHANSHCDKEELLAFVQMIGFGAFVGPASLLADLYREGEIGVVMELPAGKQCQGSATEESDIELVFSDEFRNFYKVLVGANEDFEDEDYGAFLTDFSHRIRHGTAKSVLLKKQGVPVSTAAALVDTEYATLLGAISTIPEARGHHFATTCIRALCEHSGEKTIYLMCRPDKQAFYEHLGFHKTDEYLEYISNS